jgi:hypothetical protein
MDSNIERVHEKLAELENGKPIEECLEGLEPDEAELLQLASSLRSFKPPPRKEEAINTQLAAITKMAEELPAACVVPTGLPQAASNSIRRIFPGEDKTKNSVKWPKKRWIVAFAASSVALMAMIACLSLLILDSWWSSAVRAQTATLADVSGVVMMAPAGASDDWQPATNGTHIHAGQQLRVGPDSIASLVFFEGSRVDLDAGSQVMLKKLNGNRSKVLQVEFVQTTGTTQHQVVPLRGSRSTYKVITPSGIVSVRGTSFSVDMSEGGYTRFSVNTGRVLVEQKTKQVTLTAGQAVVARSGADTLDPAYQFTLIGTLTDMGHEGWSVNGVTFMVTPDTRITGVPDVGLLVYVEGRILSDDRIADHIVVLTGGQSESSFTGILESKGEEIWRVGGVDVTITSQTEFVGDLEVSKPIKVFFSVLPDGSWLALEIISLAEPEDEPEPTPTTTNTATATMTSTATITPTANLLPTATITPPVSTGPIVITDNDQVLTINCDGAEVIVNGNNNTLTLLGTCRSLTVHGNNNQIYLESPTDVTDTGNGNIITLLGITPTATQPITSTPLPTQTPPASTGLIVITDNDQVLTINCNGAAVTVNGNNNTLTLLGTCSSLTVHGNNNRIYLESPTTIINTGNNNIIQ